VRRVAVVGCGGAGKTYVADALGARLGLPVVHADDIVYRDGVLQPEPKWQAELNASADESAWVIDAMKLSILPHRLARADTVVFLDLPRRACYYGIVRRGQLRRDVLNRAFLRWICDFPRRTRPRVLALLEGHGNVVVLRSRRQARRFLAGLH
jgi:adenylate kinase family enzyme